MQAANAQPDPLLSVEDLRVDFRIDRNVFRAVTG